MSPAWLLGGNGCPAAGRGGLPSPHRQALHIHHLLVMGSGLTDADFNPPPTYLCPVCSPHHSPHNLALLSCSIRAAQRSDNGSYVCKLNISGIEIASDPILVQLEGELETGRAGGT